MINYILGVDIGTTHIKVCLADEKLSIVKIATADNCPHVKTKECMCHSADRIWDIIVSLMKEVLPHAIGGRICGIGVTGMADCGLPVNQRGQALYPIIPWSDTCGIEYKEEILNHFSAQELYERTGQRYHPKFALSRLFYLREHETEIYHSMDCWLSVYDFILYRLTGELVTDCSLACRTMLYNINSHQWDEQLMALVDMKGRLPRVVDMGEIAGSLTINAAELLGIEGGIPVVCGGHDHLSGMIASDIKDSKTVLNSLGTAEVYAGLIPKGCKTSLCMEYGINQGCITKDSRYWMANLPSSGASIEWVRQLVSIDELVDYSIFDDAKKITTSNGLLYIPHINGSGTPHPNPQNKGMLLGITKDTTIYHLIKAVYEGISLESRWIVESIENVFGIELERITAIGGGTRNLLLMQTKADVLGKSYHLSELSEATLYGAVLQTAKQLGLQVKVSPDANGQKIDPQTENEKNYNKKYETYKNLHEAIGDYMSVSW